MKIIFFSFFLLSSFELFADCRGCCSGHHGVTCLNEITQCHDGSALSKKCEKKGCNKCTAREGLKKRDLRSYFSKWKDTDNNCLDTRQEVLKERSMVPVEIKKNPSGHCKVISGKWADFYFNEILTLASEIDIDHLVPLKLAYDLGASTWSQSKRDKFSLDPENLVITNLSYNRQKGAKTILEWMPVERSYACRYMQQWLYIKKKYDLEISSKELEYKDLLKCENVKKLPSHTVAN